MPTRVRACEGAHIRVCGRERLHVRERMGAHVCVIAGSRTCLREAAHVSVYACVCASGLQTLVDVRAGVCVRAWERACVRACTYTIMHV